MPDSYNPDCFFFYPVEETVRRHNPFTKRKIRKFGKPPARLRKLSEPG
jgi:hypothetical protein